MNDLEYNKMIKEYEEANSFSKNLLPLFFIGLFGILIVFGLIANFQQIDNCENKHHGVWIYGGKYGTSYCAKRDSIINLDEDVP